MNHIIIKVESGIVSEVYSSEPLNVIIVDHDVIEGGETFDCRMKKAVMSMISEPTVEFQDIDRIVEKMVLDCVRPKDRLSIKALSNVAA